MNSLSQHIAYLLTRHDCVIVPGWGAFISSYEPAHYDERTGMMTPPARRVSFNPGVTHNDGMLASSVARRESVSYDRAVEYVNRNVGLMKERIGNDGMLTIDGVGHFVAGNSETTPEFVPDENCGAVNLRFAMLPKLTLRPVGESSNHSFDNPKVIGKQYRHRAFRAVAGIAASFALLLGLGFALTVPDTGSDLSGNDYASIAPSRLIPFSKTVITDDVLAEVELFVALPPAGSSEKVDTAAHNAYRLSAIADRPLPSSLVKPVTSATETGDCYVVVGSFESRSRAEKFISQSGDATLRILKSGRGRYRVYAATAATFDDAMAVRSAKILKRYPDAWVYTR